MSGIAETVAGLVGALVKLIMEAVADGDVEKMRRVTDVLPPNHPMKLRAVLLVEEEKARKALGG